MQKWKHGSLGAQMYDRKCDSLWVPISFEEIKYLIFLFPYSTRQKCNKASPTLCSATQHTMPPEIVGKWGTDCLNGNPQPTLLYMGYSLKLKKRYSSKVIEKLLRNILLFFLLHYYAAQRLMKHVHQIERSLFFLNP